MVDPLRHTWRLVRRATVILLVASCAVSAASFNLPGIGGDSAEHHPGKVVWADLVTPDLAAAQRFYGGLFGWTFQAVSGGKSDYAVALDDGRPVAGLLQRAIPAGEHRQSAWLTFISVKDVDAARKRALAHGAKSVSDPKTYAGRGRQAVLSDPQGAVFAVLASAKGDPADYLAEPGEWIWSALLTRDAGQSAAFYQTLFGYDVFEGDSEAGGEHLVFSSDEYARASANSFPATSANRHPHWLDFIRVADTTRAVAQAVSLGGRVLVEPHEDRHGGNSAVVADPFGAPIGLMEWSDSEEQGGTEMKSTTAHLKLGAAGLVALLGAAGCAVTGVGYDGYDGDAGYVGGFYEPYGYDYGGWGPGYRVGPPRGGWGHGPGPGFGGHPGGPGPGGGGHPYHSAPPGRSMPSIPGRPRGR